MSAYFLVACTSAAAIISIIRMRNLPTDNTAHI